MSYNPREEQAARLRELHKVIMGAARMVLSSAIEAGEILQEVKASMPHGEFTEWVERNAGFNIRTAQRYMKIYEHRGLLKNDNVSLLADAHRTLTAPKKSKPPEWLTEIFKAITEIETFRAELKSRNAQINTRIAENHKTLAALKKDINEQKESMDVDLIMAIQKRCLLCAQESACLLIDLEALEGWRVKEIERHEKKLKQMEELIDEQDAT